MTIRRGTFGLVALVMATVLAVNFGATAAPGASTSASKTTSSTVSGTLQQFVVFGSFAFDPIVKSGKFIVGVMDCVAVGTSVKSVTISKCYIVDQFGKTYVIPGKSSAQGVVVLAKQFLNVPAVNLTQCITATALFKDGTTRTEHLASAPRGEPLLPCKLG